MRLLIRRDRGDCQGHRSHTRTRPACDTGDGVNWDGRRPGTLLLRQPRPANRTHTRARQIGEFATDYIEVRRNYTDWTPPVDRKGSDTKVSETDSHTPFAAGDRHARPDLSMSSSRRASRERERSASVDRGGEGVLWGRKDSDEGREHFAAGDRHGATELDVHRSRSRGRPGARPELASISEKVNGEAEKQG